MLYQAGDSLFATLQACRQALESVFLPLNQPSGHLSRGVSGLCKARPVLTKMGNSVLVMGKGMALYKRTCFCLILTVHYH